MQPARGFRLQVGPGVAQDDPAGGLRRAIPSTVDPELLTGAVRCPSVELDYDLCVAPGDVRFDRDLVQFDRCVPFRRWQVFIQDQGSEAVFQLAAGVGCRFRCALDCGSQVAGSARMPVEGSLELVPVDQAKELGFAERPVDLMRLQDVRQIDEGSLGRGARDAAVVRPFARFE